MILMHLLVIKALGYRTQAHQYQTKYHCRLKVINRVLFNDNRRVNNAIIAHPLKRAKTLLTGAVAES